MISDIINICRKTAIVKRYSQSHLQRPENVLEHIGFVCVASLLIGQNHPNMNLGSLLSKAACHDLEESEIGDIINPVKYANDTISSAIDELSEAAIRSISDTLDLEGLPSIWRNAKDSTLEGRTVAIVDVIAVLAKLHEEVVIYGNISIVDYAINTRSFFIRKMVDEEDPTLILVLLEALEINENILRKKP